jgi:hypothetical protein
MELLKNKKVQLLLLAGALVAAASYFDFDVAAFLDQLNDVADKLGETVEETEE